MDQRGSLMDGVKLVLTFVVTFFSSLIPQNPAAIQNQPFTDCTQFFLFWFCQMVKNIYRWHRRLSVFRFLVFSLGIFVSRRQLRFQSLYYMSSQLCLVFHTISCTVYVSHHFFLNWQTFSHYPVATESCSMYVLPRLLIATLSVAQHNK